MDGTQGMDLPSPKRWLGISARILATLFFLSLTLTLNRCDRPRRSTEPALTAQPAIGTANAWLHVQVHPEGADVTVDGLRSGTTPVSLELPAGPHVVRVEQVGHLPLEQTVDLVAEGSATLSGTLAQSPALAASAHAPSPAPPPAPSGDTHAPLPDLTVKSIKVELETGGGCDYASTQLGLTVIVENAGSADAGGFFVHANGVRKAVDAGLAPGESASLWFEGYTQDGSNRVIVDPTFDVEESTKDNNMVSERLPIPTLPPTCTPPPTPSADHGDRASPRLGNG